MTVDESISPVPNPTFSEDKADLATASSTPETTKTATAETNERSNTDTSVTLMEVADSGSVSDTTESTVYMDPAEPKAAMFLIEDLTRQLAEATQKAEKYWDSLLRKQADFDNFQKRMTRDLENAHKYALEKLATELLSVKDSMEFGLEAASKPETDLKAVREGIALTLKMLADILDKFGIVEIDPQNEKFNPRWHEAMAMQPVPNVAEGMVLHVHQKGYQLHDRLLRPARVIVAKALEQP
jgi:molecular chaperone GrpE